MSISGENLSSLNANSTQAAYLDMPLDVLDVLTLACAQGDVEKAQNAISSGARCSRDAFIKAILSENPELISLLLKNDSALTVFFWGACFYKIHFLNNLISEEGQLFDLASLLLSSERDENTDNSITVFEKDNLEVFKILCGEEYEGANGKNALRLALYFGATKISAYLFSLGVKIPELENIQKEFKLSLKSFLPIFHLITIEEDKKEIKSFLRVDFDELNRQKYQKILEQLFSNKSTIMEMAVYLALNGKKEDLEESDEFGLRPVDYAILGYAYGTLSEDFFHFLTKCKVNITLGDHTVLHLACFLNVYADFFSKILQACEECLPKVKIKKNLIKIINLEDHRNIHRKLPWGKIEFVNRMDPYGLTALHHAANPEYEFDFVERDSFIETQAIKNKTRIVALLLEAGAKSEPGPFREFEYVKIKSIQVPFFIKKDWYLYRNWSEKFLQLTPLMLTQKIEMFRNGDKTLSAMIKLFNEKISPKEILNPNTLKDYFPASDEEEVSSDADEEVFSMEE